METKGKLLNELKERILFMNPKDIDFSQIDDILEVLNGKGNNDNEPSQCEMIADDSSAEKDMENSMNMDKTETSVPYFWELYRNVMREFETSLLQLRDKIGSLTPEDISEEELNDIFSILNRQDEEVQYEQVMNFEEVAELVYQKLEEGKGELQEEIVLFSDFSADEKNDESTVSNAIGIRTVSIFDECNQRFLAIGVFGEDFTNTYSYFRDEIVKDEVLDFIKTWLCTMRPQLCNDRLLLKEIQK